MANNADYYKKCQRCKLIKAAGDYNKNSSNKDGLQHTCTFCRKAYYAANKVKILNSHKLYRTKHRAKYLQVRRQNYERNKTYLNYARRARRTKDLDYLETTRKQARLSYYRNHKKRLAQKKNYRENNKDVVNSLVTKRRAAKLKATPNWLTGADYNTMRGFYTAAVELKALAHCRLVVDHIIPLLGKDVCGLHVPWNLQLLTAEENAQKGNRLHEVDDKTNPAS